MYQKWRPYVPVAQRRRQAERQVAALQKKGKSLAPVVVQSNGRAIARTFWGDSWCRNLEAYSDYANRLPRGRTYVRGRAVVDLQISAGSVTALVQGSALYRIGIQIRPLAAPRWKALVAACSGHIGSLVELLRGGLNDAVMKRVTEPKTGLFPAPPEISLECSCPDWASMCKHVAAALYGVGVRLDETPELLFTLRGVDPADLVARAAAGGTLRDGAPRGRVLHASRLSDVFGVEIDQTSPVRAPRVAAAAILPKATEPPRLPSKKTRGRAFTPPASWPDPLPTGAVVSLEERITGLLATLSEASLAQIARALGTTEHDLITPVSVLLSDGKIESEGSGRATRYRTAPAMPVPPPGPRSRVRPVRGKTANARRTSAAVSAVAAQERARPRRGRGGSH